MITITQIGKESYELGENAWLFSFRIKFFDVDWVFRTLVPESVPKADRLKAAKTNLRTFAATLSAKADEF